MRIRGTYTYTNKLPSKLVVALGSNGSQSTKFWYSPAGFFPQKIYFFCTLLNESHECLGPKQQPGTRKGYFLYSSVIVEVRWLDRAIRLLELVSYFYSLANRFMNPDLDVITITLQHDSKCNRCALHTRLFFRWLCFASFVFWKPKFLAKRFGF